MQHFIKFSSPPKIAHTFRVITFLSKTATDNLSPFIKALFPTKELDNIERATLSIGMSLALVPITGLLLNYTPWGIRATPVTLSLLALTTTFATAAVTREFHLTRKHENSLQ